MVELEGMLDIPDKVMVQVGPEVCLVLVLQFGLEAVGAEDMVQLPLVYC